MILRNPETGEVLNSPFFGGLIVGILLMFLVPGLIYGMVVRSDKDAVKQMVDSLKPFSNYIVLVFFAAQFVYFFKHSRLGIIMAIHGAEFLQGIGFTGVLLMMAPVFIPMFMLLGYHPSLTQVAYRIGDSTTNLTTPMMSYFALIVAFSQKYDEKYGIGTIVATMLPYTLFFLIFWIIMLGVGMLLGLPLGPGGPWCAAATWPSSAVS